MDLHIGLFSERLKTLLAGEEGTLPLPVAAKEHIQNLQTETNYLVRESEIVIDTFIMSNMQPDGDQSCFKELYAILVRLESKFIDIKQQLQPVLPLHNFSFSVWMGELKNKCSLRLQRDNMVSLQDDVMEELLDQLVEGPSQLSVVAIIDSCGFGSTDFAAQAYNSNYVKSYFDCRAWVSFDINRGTMLDNILKFVMPQPALREIMHKDFEQRKMALHDYLGNKRYLIVVDDVIASDVWDYIGKALPDHQNGSRVLVMLSNDKIFSLCSLENGEMIHLDSVPARPLRATYQERPLVFLYYERNTLAQNIRLTWLIQKWSPLFSIAELP
ncbi:hypothetical protein WN943_023708 [Citrus x changshan-huyou]